MCFNFITLYNPTTDFLPSDPFRLSVPCGVCDECKQQRKNDYYVRILEQLRACPSDSWLNGFLTLTFNDEHLPITSMCDLYGEEHTFPCFDSHLVSNFFRRIYKHLNKKFGVKEIKWIACPEYGEHTRRPHYHCIICIPRYGKEGQLIDITYIYKLFNKFWANEIGFICPATPFGNANANISPFELSNTSKSARYTSKYCLKDADFYDLPCIAKLEKTYRAFLKRKDDEDCVSWCKKFRQIMPRVLMSQRFGSCIDEKISCSKDPIAAFEEGLRDDTPDRRKLKYPSYTMRRLMTKARTISVTDKDGSIKNVVRYYKTDFAKLYEKTHFEHKINSLSNVYKPFIEKPSDYFMSWLRDSNNLDRYYYLRNKVNSHDIAIYINVYRNRICIPVVNLLVNTTASVYCRNYSDVDFDVLRSHAFQFKFAYIDYLKTQNNNISSANFSIYETFNKTNCCHLLEDFVCLIEDYNKACRPAIYSAKKIQLNAQNSLKSLYKNFGKINKPTLPNFRTIQHTQFQIPLSTPLNEETDCKKNWLYGAKSEQKLLQYAKMRNKSLREKSCDFIEPANNTDRDIYEQVSTHIKNYTFVPSPRLQQTKDSYFELYEQLTNDKKNEFPF